jgi:hypothetical protein
MDIKNWATYADCFTDDVELDTRPAGGRDRNEALAILCRPVETVHTCRHIHSPAMTFNADGSANVIRAGLIWAMQDHVTWGAGGHWRIARTKLARLHSDNHLEGGITQAAPNPVPG